MFEKGFHSFTFSLSSPDIAIESKHRLACCRVRRGDQS